MSDTSAIDEKKDNGSTVPSNIGANIGKFLFTLLIIIGIVIFYFCLGGSVLYGCKLAQSNILPTDIHCFPYTDTKPEIKPILTNIFTTFTNPSLSVKLSFPYDAYNSKNAILDLFRDYKKEPKSNFLANYFISIIEALTCFNYKCIQFILNMLNGLPEPLIVLFGPILVSFSATFIFLSDNFYLIYLWFSKMSWLFKENQNTGNEPPIWKNVTIYDPFNYFIALCLLCLFCFLFFVLLFALPVLPILTTTWCLFSCLCFKSIINNKSINLLSIWQDLFKFYKVTIMSIFSFFVVISAFANLGSLAGVMSLITLALISWGVISVDLFKQVKPEELSELVSNAQASKKCEFVPKPENKHGFLYNLIFPQKGGRHLVNELKKIGKKLEKS
jgi:hypothetical protein